MGRPPLQQMDDSAFSAARKLELVYGGEIVIGVLVLDVADPLEDGVEQRQLDARVARNLSDELEERFDADSSSGSGRASTEGARSAVNTSVLVAGA